MTDRKRSRDGSVKGAAAAERRYQRTPGDAGTDGGSRSDDHDRDKSGNQTILLMTAPPLLSGRAALL
jgi:hypothetical protein